MRKEHIFIFCRCAGAALVDPSAREVIERAMKSLPADHATCVDDLCALAERRDPLLAEFASREGPKVIIACHERAVRALLEFSGCGLDGRTRILNARTGKADEIVAEIAERKIEGKIEGLTTIPSAESVSVPDLPKSGTDSDLEDEIVLCPSISDGWAAWYPVIDSARCVQCKKCLGFCLFGVYALEGEKVRVANPRSCKNNCPACARVCPSLAIIFPKCKDSPINGAAVTEQDLARKDLKVNIEAIAKSPDLYEELRKRAGQAGQKSEGHG